MKKKVLVVTPRFPYPETGACEQDRAEGIRQLQRLGYEVRVVGKFFDWQDTEVIKKEWAERGVPVQLVPYKYHRLPVWLKIKKMLPVLARPSYLDGAAFEYTDPEIRRVLETTLESFRPDLVWFDYTYLWPLYSLVKKHRLPIIVRSINFEPTHFLAEDGRTIKNYLKSWPKYASERITARAADILFSINPQERVMYQRLGTKNVFNLPLRALPKKLGTHAPKESAPLKVFFSGSTYNVAHNRRALEFIVKEIAPAMRGRCPDQFCFYITGNKFPDDLRPFLSATVVYAGGREDYENFLQAMDIALVPSFFGAGMQQKIFEPLARGFPTITHARGLAGYDFAPGKEVLLAGNLDSFCQALGSLRSLPRRQELSQNAKLKSQKLFSVEGLDNIVRSALSL